ncbi:hypothetical protein LIER_34203 [Lithospermum erythrorhizon]|uniref:Reverse transcriptase Ty1/copia-type domain-containing protein n=1 Tax=Lithospermum erythrorhizon TaxID=34254 RepID=A0AAV3S1V6_LITER
MQDFKAAMLRDFDMTNLEEMHYFLGIEVVQHEKGIFVCQRQYAEEILKRFGMSYCNPSYISIAPAIKLDKDVEGEQVDDTFYKQIIGSLMYLTATRPDLMFVTRLISRYMTKPTELHLQGVVAWSSKKQPIVTLSTTEAEFIAAAGCSCQAIWLKRILNQVGFEDGSCTQINFDNSSAIKLSKNPVIHGRSNHIDVRLHFLRNFSKDGMIELIHCSTTEQITNIMTKSLKIEIFHKLRNMLGMKEFGEVN